jgi:hypothetical protein
MRPNYSFTELGQEVEQYRRNLIEMIEMTVPANAKNNIKNQIQQRINNDFAHVFRKIAELEREILSR